MELYQIMAVVDRENEDALRDVYRRCGTSVTITMPARGTASNDMLAFYGLAPTEKRVVCTVADAAEQRAIFRTARQQLYMDIPGRGILAAIPIKSAAGRQTLAFLTDSEIKGGKPPMEFEYELIIVILNEGYADLVMDAARSAGATGGTLLHAKGTGGARGEKFFGVSLADEKDMIYIVSHRDDKAAVMKEISRQAGPASPARGICFSLPISAVMGLRQRDPETASQAE